MRVPLVPQAWSIPYCLVRYVSAEAAGPFARATSSSGSLRITEQTAYVLRLRPHLEGVTAPVMDYGDYGKLR